MRVASCACGNSVCSCAGPKEPGYSRTSSCSCGNSVCTCVRVKEAVYHGITPNTYGPYTKWTQAHQRDLTDSDYDLILKSARTWLKSEVVSGATEGGVRDTQLRAALDLAIRDTEGGKYSGAIQPNVYNMMLARLAGTKDETGMTVREASKKSASRLKKGSIEYTSECIRSMAVKVASINPAMAYEMVELADTVSAEVTPEPPGYDALRSAVLKMASESPEAQKTLLPILRLIKAQDEAKKIRAEKARTSK